VYFGGNTWLAGGSTPTLPQVPELGATAMTNKANHPCDIWLDPLIELINSWGDHDPEGCKRFTRVYIQELKRLGC